MHFALTSRCWCLVLASGLWGATDIVPKLAPITPFAGAVFLEGPAKPFRLVRWACGGCCTNTPLPDTAAAEAALRRAHVQLPRAPRVHPDEERVHLIYLSEETSATHSASTVVNGTGEPQTTNHAGTFVYHRYTKV